MAKAAQGVSPCPSAWAAAGAKISITEAACRGLSLRQSERRALPCFVSLPQRSSSCVSASSPASADAKRVALIIGMSEYQHLSSLTNPVRDAKAIATELRDHGFEVSEHYNLDRADLLDALEKFKRQAQDAEVALVYYAGHGMEIDGKNVVAPTDMEIECARQVHDPLGRARALYRRGRAGAAADRDARRLPQQSLPAMPDARHWCRQRLSRLLAARPRRTARCSSPMPRCRASSPPTAIRRAFALRQVAAQRISTRTRASIPARCARA